MDSIFESILAYPLLDMSFTVKVGPPLDPGTSRPVKNRIWSIVCPSSSLFVASMAT